MTRYEVESTTQSDEAIYLPDFQPPDCLVLGKMDRHGLTPSQSRSNQYLTKTKA